MDVVDFNDHYHLVIWRTLQSHLINGYNILDIDKNYLNDQLERYRCSKEFRYLLPKNYNQFYIEIVLIDNSKQIFGPYKTGEVNGKFNNQAP